ncbi:MAG TPA: hypothetical protein VH105_21100 [Burkholderiales bacterium]|nr:hypothetical protein [Burkholderiales bacterium]
MLGNIFKGAKSANSANSAESATKTPEGAPGPQARSFLPYFDQNFAGLLEHRAPGFRVMFERLEARGHTAAPALIVETGSMREAGNWAGDGQSTFLWNEFGGFFKSEVHTVDLAPEAAVVVREYCCGDVTAHTGDSVAFLHEMATRANPPQIDLLYLDSYDYDIADPFPSAFHHIKELIAVRPCLRRGSVIAIDDNYVHPDGRIEGKGYLAAEFFRHLGIPCIHQGHQLVWQL